MYQVSKTRVHAEIGDHLARRRIRYTSGRRRVVATLRAADGPQNAAEIHRRLGGTVPLSSIYRSLAVLDGAGLLSRHHDADGVARFELAAWLTGHHHHLVCTECGRVEDVELDDRAERLLAELAHTAGASAGYQIRDHELEAVGVCGSCRG